MTGLIVADTPTVLSVFGQVVVMLLIQAGGLGYMTISTILAIAVGRQLSVQERLTLQEALNVDSMEGLARFTIRIFKLTLAVELLGAALLALRWTGEMGIGKAMYFGLFHAVSAFNNAGFALFSDSLIRYRADWLVNLVVSALIVVGGIGFVVLTELGALRRGRRLSVHSRLVLTMTALLIVLGTAGILLLEYRNPRTLGPLGPSERLLASWFQAVSPRTAGFNTLDIGALTATTGARSPPLINCSARIRRLPSLPPGCRLAKSSWRNPFATSRVIANASPSASAADVLAVGTRFSGQASAETRQSSATSAARPSVEPPSPVIAISRAPRRLIVSRSRKSSSVSPL